MKLMQLPQEVRERILDSARNVITSQCSGTRVLISCWNEVLTAEYAYPGILPGNSQVVTHNPAVPPETQV